MMHMGGGTTVTCSMGFPGHFLEHDVFTQTLILVEGDTGSAQLDRDYWIRVTTQPARVLIVTRRCGGPGCTLSIWHPMPALFPVTPFATGIARGRRSRDHFGRQSEDRAAHLHRL